MTSTMGDENRVSPQESDEYDPKPESNTITPQESDEYDLINPEPKHSKYYYDYNRNGDMPNPFATDPLSDNDDQIAHHINTSTSFDYADAVDFQVDNMVGAAETLNIDTSGYGQDVVTFGEVPDWGDDTSITGNPLASPDTITFADAHDPKPTPDLSFKSQKYQEDKGIADLKDYVSSTYRGHYTNKNSDTQTLDLIHSVGDAESFCRSNALKYLSRYDKKGSAKQDILKAMHYCLLLYYFSGNTKEPEYTNTRYETF